MENIFGILEIPMGGHQRIARSTTKSKPKNKIYYGTQPKRITIFRHPHKKRKWQNHHRHPTIHLLQKPPPQKLYKIHPLHTST